MIKNIFRIVSLLCLINSFAAGQAWQSYTNLNPIQETVAEGDLIWAATEGGVFAFSVSDTSPVYRFTNVDGLPSTDVRCLALDSRHRLYFGTAGSGLAVLDSSRSRFDWINSRDQNIISDSITTVLCQGNYVFLGSPGGISFYDGSTWHAFSHHQYPMGPEVLSLAWRNDSLFIGTNHGLSAAPLSGLSGPNYMLWQRFPNTGIGDSSLLSLLATDTAIIAGTARGLSRLSGASWTEAFNLGRRVRSIKSHRDTLYLATSQGALKIFSGTVADISAGLPSPDLRSLTISNDSILWAGTAEGLARRHGGTWQPFRLNGIPSNRVTRAVAGTDGSIWLAHYVPFASRIRPQGSIVNYQSPVAGIPVSSLVADPAGNAWYGLSWWDGAGKSYLARIDQNDSLTLFSSPPLPQRVGLWDGFCGSDGNLYFAAYSHVATNYIVVLKPDGTLSELIVDPNQSSYMNPLSVARDEAGAVWIGSYSNSLARYDPASQSWRYFGTESGLSNTRIYDIAFGPSDFIWLASSDGLNRGRYDPGLQQLAEVKVYKSSDSPLLSNEVRALARDRSGNLWIATGRGLNLLSWDGQWTAFTTASPGSKLLSDDVQYVSVRPRDESGDDILIATSRGLSIYHYDRAASGQEASVSVAPNPLRPGRDRALMFCHLPDEAAISLYTLEGRLLASWAGPRAPAHILTIDIARELGPRLSSGLYLCHIRSRSGRSQVIKLAVLR